MNENPVKTLEALGQSIWIDFIRRGVLKSGDLKRWIDQDGVSGVTSNPTIFEKAIVDSTDYDDEIEQLAHAGKSPADIYETLTVEDIQHTADLFRPMYDRTRGGDGFVSLEVSPHLANDTAGTIEEARRLWQAVNRPNVMIKIPGTRAGLPAIQQMISEGVNINITLLFGLPRYREVIDAYLHGLEIRAAQNQPIDHIASVASFFLSRIDVLLDPQLEKMMQSSNAAQADLAKKLHGQVAIASAKVAYSIFNEIFHGERFKRLSQKGAHVQRLLWASTSTKNPAYSDVKYVEALIGPETIDTIPVETLEAYRDHGKPQLTLTEGLADARTILRSLPELGLDIDQTTQQLEEEGTQKFNASFDKLMARLTEKVAVKAK